MKIDISQATKEFDKHVIIISPPRAGSNNLSFILHIQDGFFSFSERVDPGFVWFHDCMGNAFGKQCSLPEDKLVNKLLMAKTLVWKKNPEKMEFVSVPGTASEAIIVCSGDPSWLCVTDKQSHLNTVIIAHFRHPALVFRSCAKMYSKTGEEEWNISAKGIVKFFVNQFMCINLNWTSSCIGADIIVSFQEDFIQSPDKALKRILSHLSPKRLENPNMPKVFIIENYGKNATSARGYGFYNPLRKISFYDELKSLGDELKLEDIDFIDEISKCVSREVELNEQSSKVLDEFVDYYRDVERKIG